MTEKEGYHEKHPVYLMAGSFSSFHVSWLSKTFMTVQVVGHLLDEN